MPLTKADGTPMRVGFVGAGMMGGAMIKGLVSTGTVKAYHINVFDIDEARSRAPHVPPVPVCVSNSAVGSQSDMVVIAVEPKDTPKVCAELCDCPHLDGGVEDSAAKIYISLAAGVTLASLASWLPAGAKIARVMPNTPCVVGEMAAGYVCNEQCDAADTALVGAMLGALGSALKVAEEEDLDAVTGVSGSGPAYVFQFIEAMSDGGVRMGLSRQVATTLAAKCVRGAATMVLETGRHPGALKDDVTSPGGTTIAAIHALECGGMRAAVINAVVAATEKSRELGRAGASAEGESGGSGGGGANGKKRARDE